MKIERTRYVITRNNRTEIFCGLLRNYTFKKIEDLGNTAIKTYESKERAESSFKRSWFNIDFEYEILPVKESIVEVIE